VAAVVGVVVALGIAVGVTYLLTSKKATPTATVPTTQPVHHSTVVHDKAAKARATTTTTTTARAEEQIAARALSALLTQSVVDRSDITNASNDVSSCGPTLANDAKTFETAAASRQSLLSELSGLTDESTLPPTMIQTLTMAWQASEQVDDDYSSWASAEYAQGCVPDDTSNPYFQAAGTPNTQATQYKQNFVNAWNPIATEYGLATYQWDQL
jgi:hypothetical protein